MNETTDDDDLRDTENWKGGMSLGNAFLLCVVIRRGDDFGKKSHEETQQ